MRLTRHSIPVYNVIVPKANFLPTMLSEFVIDSGPFSKEFSREVCFEFYQECIRAEETKYLKILLIVSKRIFKFIELWNLRFPNLSVEILPTREIKVVSKGYSKKFYINEGGEDHVLIETTIDHSPQINLLLGYILRAFNPSERALDAYFFEDPPDDSVLINEVLKAMCSATTNHSFDMSFRRFIVEIFEYLNEHPDLEFDCTIYRPRKIFNVVLEEINEHTEIN